MKGEKRMQGAKQRFSIYGESRIRHWDVTRRTSERELGADAPRINSSSTRLRRPNAEKIDGILFA